MEASKGWYQYAWSPVIGCKHGCAYCYARDMFDDYENPRFFVKRLSEPEKYAKPSVIFVCPYADLFGDWVPELWINSVIEVVRQNPIHQFVFITKNPGRYHEFRFPDNVYLGVTVESPEKIFRAKELDGMPNKKLASIEPVMGDFTGVDLSVFDWVVCGYMIGRKTTKQDRNNMKSISHANKYIIIR